MTRILFLAVLGFCFLPINVQAQTNGRKLALLVGVREYEHDGLTRLNYTENDAADLAAILKKSGYTVVLMTDSAGKANRNLRPTLKNIREQLHSLVKGGKRDDMVVVGLSGHGLQFEEDTENYFCPTDARPTKAEKNTLLPFTEVLGTLADNGIGMKLLLVDACRNDPNSGKGIDTRSIRPPKGSAILFSCSKGQRAFENAQLKHGVFFHFVLEGLKGKAVNAKGEVTWSSLTEYVSESVTLEVPNLIGDGARQEPNMISNVNGRFPVLIGKVRGNDASTINAKGLEFDRKGDYTQALREFSQAVELDPRNAVYLTNKGLALLNLSEYTRADQELDAALQINPNYAAAHNSKGVIAYRQRAYDQAVRDYSKAIELTPNVALYWKNRALAHFDRQEFADALNDAQRAVELNPKDDRAYNILGNALYRKKNFDKAIPNYTKAIEINPKDSVYFSNRGDAHYQSKDFDKALQDFNESIRVNPKYAPVWNLRAILYYDVKKDFEQAVQDYSKAIELNPNDAVYYKNRAMAYEKLGKKSHADVDYAYAKKLTGEK